MLTTLLFDYGGTLDTAARHWSYVLHEGYARAGVELSQEAFRPAYVFAERALAKYPYIRREDDFLDLLRKKVALEVEGLERSGAWRPAGRESRARLVDCVSLYCDGYARAHTARSAQVLAALHRRYRVVIVSNFYGNLPTILSAYGLARHVDAVIESARVGVRKPDPAIWLKGAEAACAAPSECMAIGDSYGKDVLAARKAGCRTVWFKGEEWEVKDYDESVPDHVITSLSDLKSLLL